MMWSFNNLREPSGSTHYNFVQINNSVAKLVPVDYIQFTHWRFYDLAQDTSYVDLSPFSDGQEISLEINWLE